ncbi:polysialyltransferase family glycosyltransferase [Demequina sp. SO4-18]|uniref:polysialyltransferase family glycosyltransferase n=1 Tax=Demequina sp. SO4-18 TaxID=3401026 RepID=UPI003B5969EC
MTIIAVAPTLMAGAIIAAAIDDGLLPGRRVLVTVNDAEIPEVTPTIAAHRGFDSLAARFDEVVHLNDVIAPLHPRGLGAATPHGRAVQARLVEAAGGHVSRLVVPALRRDPVNALARMFPDARIDAVADGLMAYGPTAARLGRDIAARVERHLYVDLVPGTRPRQFADAGAEPVEVAMSGVRAAIASMAGTPTPTDTDEAWILGEPRSGSGALTPEDNGALDRRLLDAAADAGFQAVAFTPHPDARPSYPVTLAQRAAQRSVRFRVITGAEPTELMLERTRPRAILGRASTALATASALYGVPAFSVGTADLARAIRAKDDPRRVALALTRASVPSLEDGEQPPLAVEAQALLDVLCHDMSPRRHPRPDDSARAAVAQCDGAREIVETPGRERRAHARDEADSGQSGGGLVRRAGSVIGRGYRGVRSVLAAVWFSARL